jgi:small-conductance mechanosensitive channel
MKLQSWTLSILGTILAAAILGGGSMIISANSEIKSIQTADKLYEAQRVNFEADTKSDIKEVKEIIKDFRNEIKQDNDKMTRMIERMMRE